MFDRLNRNRPDTDTSRKTIVDRLVARRIAFDPELADRLSPAERLAVARSRLEPSTADDQPEACFRLIDLMPRFDSADKARILDQLMDQCKLEFWNQGTMRTTVIGLFDQIDPVDSGRITGKLMARIAANLEEKSDFNDLQQIAGLLGSIGKGPVSPDPGTVWLPAIRALDRAMARQSDVEHRVYLAWGLGPMADRLGPEGAAKVCLPVAEALTGSFEEVGEHPGGSPLIGALAAMSLRLPPEPARKIIRLLAILAEKVQADSGVAYDFDHLLSNLSEDDAGRAARVIVLALDGEQDAKVRWSLGAGLCLVARIMRPAEASEICGPFAGQMVESFLLMGLYKGNLGPGLGIVTSRLPESRRQEVIQPLLDALNRATEGERAVLMVAIVASLGQRDPLATSPVDWTLYFGQTGKSFDFAREFLTRELGPAAGRVPAPELAAFLIAALEREPSLNGRPALARTLEALAGRVPASEVGAVLAAALERETNFDCHGAIRDALLAVIRRMAPAEAARLSGRMARWLARSVEAKEIGKLSIQRTLDVVKFSEQLPSDEAGALCVGVLQRILTPRVPELEDGRGVLGIDERMPAMLAEIHPEIAHLVARELSSLLVGDGSFVVVRRMGGAGSRFDSSDAPSADPASLESLLIDDSRSQRAARKDPGADTPASSTPTYPCRLTTQELVDLLKMPTCFGEARHLILEQLGNRYGRKFASHWEFVRFARQQRFDLDLTTPPRRPDPKASLRRILVALEGANRR